MNALTKRIGFLAACAIAACFVTEAQAYDAKVVKLSGTVEIQLPGQTTAQPLTPAMTVPQGALIQTGADAQLMLEAFPGAVATIGSNSVVAVEKLAMTKQGTAVSSQEALLDLRSGSIVSTIDPAKKAISQYGVRTPRGIATARGTVYGVAVSVSGTSVATLNGSVTLNLGNGVSVSIPVGSASVNDATTVTNLAAAIQASGQTGLTVAQLLQETVQAVADNVAASSSAAGTAETATTIMASVVSAASAAQPEQAAAFTQAAVAAISSSTSATAGSSTAVAAITEAAVRAAPAATAQIAQAAAQAVVETRVTQAVAAAQASGADPVAAAESASQGAAETISAITQTAANAAAAMGASADTQTIAAAVAEGSTAGADSASQITGITVSAPDVPAVAAPTTPSTPLAPPNNIPVITPDVRPVSGSA